MKNICMLFFLLGLGPVVSFAIPINVYIRLDDVRLHQAVSEFNNQLKRRGILARYAVEPYLNRYPMHATLYLTEYPIERVGRVVETARQLACNVKPVQLEIKGISVTSGNYVMLNVDNVVMPENPPLQQLSDQATLKLSGLRDYNAPIPDWAKSIPIKRKAFERYGSPNVFFEFSPHLSLMAPEIIDEKRSLSFREEVEAVIREWNFPSLSVNSSILGVGYTNAQGQITGEIARFNLEPCPN